MEVGQLIVKTPGTCGGRARGASKRIPVSSVYRWFLGGCAPGGIMGEFDGITLSEVYAAIFHSFADFVPLHARWIIDGRTHSGIIVFPQQELSIGETVRKLVRLVHSLPAEDMRNRLEWLNNWGSSQNKQSGPPATE